MRQALKRLAAWLSDLRVAIVLLLLIALASGIGTGIPQGDPAQSYRDAYDASPWIGMLSGDQVLALNWTMCIPAAGSWRCWPGWGWHSSSAAGGGNGPPYRQLAAGSTTAPRGS